MKTDFKNKKIGILGLGEENIALIRYFLKHGIKKLTICDQKSREELENNLSKIDISRNNFDLRLGAKYLENLSDFEIIFRSPGLPYLNEKIQQAKKEDVKISSATKLFFAFCPSPIIGVTGTKGKGTTATLIAEILKSNVKGQRSNVKKNIYLGGNIGNSPMEFLDKLTKNDIVILELSSFQLQDMDVSPHIAIVLDVKVDHLDHHKDEKEYFFAKQNIVKFQRNDDIAIINADYPTSNEFAKHTPAQKYWFSRQKKVEGAFIKNNEIILKIKNNTAPIAKTDEITLRGKHNLENICAAVTAVNLVGAKVKTISKIVKSFPGLEHRLEFITEINSVKFYNDSFSTTPDTAIAAIKSFDKPIILIAGGSEKNADYSELGKVIASTNVKTAILIGKTGPRIEEKIQNSKFKIQNERENKLKIINNCKNMKEVIATVKSEMRPGDVVLLSPASASFDWFKNYKERGKIFKEEVMKLKGNLS